MRLKIEFVVPSVYILNWFGGAKFRVVMMYWTVSELSGFNDVR